MDVSLTADALPVPKGSDMTSATPTASRLTSIPGEVAALISNIFSGLPGMQSSGSATSAEAAPHTNIAVNSLTERKAVQQLLPEMPDSPRHAVTQGDKYVPPPQPTSVPPSLQHLSREEQVGSGADRHPGDKFPHFILLLGRDSVTGRAVVHLQPRSDGLSVDHYQGNDLLQSLVPSPRLDAKASHLMQKEWREDPPQYGKDFDGEMLKLCGEAPEAESIALLEHLSHFAPNATTLLSVMRPRPLKSSAIVPLQGGAVRMSTINIAPDYRMDPAFSSNADSQPLGFEAHDLTQFLEAISRRSPDTGRALRRLVLQPAVLGPWGLAGLAITPHARSSIQTSCLDVFDDAEGDSDKKARAQAMAVLAKHLTREHPDEMAAFLRPGAQPKPAPAVGANGSQPAECSVDDSYALHRARQTITRYSRLYFSPPGSASLSFRTVIRKPPPSSRAENRALEADSRPPCTQLYTGSNGDSGDVAIDRSARLSPPPILQPGSIDRESHLPAHYSTSSLRFPASSYAPPPKFDMTFYSAEAREARSDAARAKVRHWSNDRSFTRAGRTTAFALEGCTIPSGGVARVLVRAPGAVHSFQLKAEADREAAAEAAASEHADEVEVQDATTFSQGDLRGDDERRYSWLSTRDPRLFAAELACRAGSAVRLGCHQDPLGVTVDVTPDGLVLGDRVELATLHRSTVPWPSDPNPCEIPPVMGLIMEVANRSRFPVSIVAGMPVAQFYTEASLPAELKAVGHDAPDLEIESVGGRRLHRAHPPSDLIPFCEAQSEKTVHHLADVLRCVLSIVDPTDPFQHAAYGLLGESAVKEFVTFVGDLTRRRTLGMDDGGLTDDDERFALSVFVRHPAYLPVFGDYETASRRLGFGPSLRGPEPCLYVYDLDDHTKRLDIGRDRSLAAGLRSSNATTAASECAERRRAHGAIRCLTRELRPQLLAKLSCPSIAAGSEQLGCFSCRTALRELYLAKNLAVPDDAQPAELHHDRTVKTLFDELVQPRMAEGYPDVFQQGQRRHLFAHGPCRDAVSEALLKAGNLLWLCPECHQAETRGENRARSAAESTHHHHLENVDAASLWWTVSALSQTYDLGGKQSFVPRDTDTIATRAASPAEHIMEPLVRKLDAELPLSCSNVLAAIRRPTGAMLIAVLAVTFATGMVVAKAAQLVDFSSVPTPPCSPPEQPPPPAAPPSLENLPLPISPIVAPASSEPSYSPESERAESVSRATTSAPAEPRRDETKPERLAHLRASEIRTSASSSNAAVNPDTAGEGVSGSESPLPDSVVLSVRDVIQPRPMGAEGRRHWLKIPIEPGVMGPRAMVVKIEPLAERHYSGQQLLSAYGQQLLNQDYVAVPRVVIVRPDDTEVSIALVGYPKDRLTLRAGNDVARLVPGRVATEAEADAWANAESCLDFVHRAPSELAEVNAACLELEVDKPAIALLVSHMAACGELPHACARAFYTGIHDYSVHPKTPSPMPAALNGLMSDREYRHYLTAGRTFAHHDDRKRRDEHQRVLATGVMGRPGRLFEQRCQSIERAIQTIPNRVRAQYDPSVCYAERINTNEQRQLELRVVRWTEPTPAPSDPRRYSERRRIEIAELRNWHNFAILAITTPSDLVDEYGNDPNLGRSPKVGQRAPVDHLGVPRYLSHPKDPYRLLDDQDLKEFYYEPPHDHALNTEHGPCVTASLDAKLVRMVLVQAVSDCEPNDGSKPWRNYFVLCHNNPLVEQIPLEPGETDRSSYPTDRHTSYPLHPISLVPGRRDALDDRWKEQAGVDRAHGPTRASPGSSGSTWKRRAAYGLAQSLQQPGKLIPANCEEDLCSTCPLKTLAAWKSSRAHFCETIRRCLDGGDHHPFMLHECLAFFTSLGLRGLKSVFQVALDDFVMHRLPPVHWDAIFKKIDALAFANAFQNGLKSNPDSPTGWEIITHIGDLTSRYPPLKIHQFEIHPLELAALVSVDISAVRTPVRRRMYLDQLLRFEHSVDDGLATTDWHAYGLRAPAPLQAALGLDGEGQLTNVTRKRGHSPAFVDLPESGSSLAICALMRKLREPLQDQLCLDGRQAMRHAASQGLHDFNSPIRQSLSQSITCHLDPEPLLSAWTGDEESLSSFSCDHSVHRDERLRLDPTDIFPTPGRFGLRDESDAEKPYIGRSLSLGLTDMVAQYLFERLEHVKPWAVEFRRWSTRCAIQLQEQLEHRSQPISLARLGPDTWLEGRDGNGDERGLVTDPLSIDVRQYRETITFRTSHSDLCQFGLTDDPTDEEMRDSIQTKQSMRISLLRQLLKRTPVFHACWRVGGQDKHPKLYQRRSNAVDKYNRSVCEDERARFRVQYHQEFCPSGMYGRNRGPLGEFTTDLDTEHGSDVDEPLRPAESIADASSGAQCVVSRGVDEVHAALVADVVFTNDRLYREVEADVDSDSHRVESESEEREFLPLVVPEAPRARGVAHFKRAGDAVETRSATRLRTSTTEPWDLTYALLPAASTRPASSSDERRTRSQSAAATSTSAPLPSPPPSPAEPVEPRFELSMTVLPLDEDVASTRAVTTLAASPNDRVTLRQLLIACREPVDVPDPLRRMQSHQTHLSDSTFGEYCRLGDLHLITSLIKDLAKALCQRLSPNAFMLEGAERGIVSTIYPLVETDSLRRQLQQQDVRHWTRAYRLDTVPRALHRYWRKAIYALLPKRRAVDAGPQDLPLRPRVLLDRVPISTTSASRRPCYHCSRSLSCPLHDRDRKGGAIDPVDVATLDWEPTASRLTPPSDAALLNLKQLWHEAIDDPQAVVPDLINAMRITGLDNLDLTSRGLTGDDPSKSQMVARAIYLHTLRHNQCGFPYIRRPILSTPSPPPSPPSPPSPQPLPPLLSTDAQALLDAEDDADARPPSPQPLPPLLSTDAQALLDDPEPTEVPTRHVGLGLGFAQRSDPTSCVACMAPAVSAEALGTSAESSYRAPARAHPLKWPRCSTAGCDCVTHNGRTPRGLELGACCRTCRDSGRPCAQPFHVTPSSLKHKAMTALTRPVCANRGCMCTSIQIEPDTTYVWNQLGYCSDACRTESGCRSNVHSKQQGHAATKPLPLADASSDVFTSRNGWTLLTRPSPDSPVCSPPCSPPGSVNVDPPRIPCIADPTLGPTPTCSCSVCDNPVLNELYYGGDATCDLCGPCGTYGVPSHPCECYDGCAGAFCGSPEFGDEPPCSPPCSPPNSDAGDHAADLQDLDDPPVINTPSPGASSGLPSAAPPASPFTPYAEFIRPTLLPSFNSLVFTGDQNAAITLLLGELTSSITGVRDENDAMRTRHVATQNRLADAERTANELQQSLTDTRHQMADLQVQADESEAVMASLQTRAEEVETQRIASIRMSEDARRSVDDARLSSQMQALAFSEAADARDNKMTDLVSNCDRYKTRLDDVIDQLDNAEGALKRAEAELAGVDSSNTACANCARLKARIQRLEDEAQDTCDSLSEYDNLVAELRLSISAGESARAQDRTELGLCESAGAQDRTEIVQKDAEIARHLLAISVNNQALQDASDRLDRLTAKESKLLNEVVNSQIAEKLAQRQLEQALSTGAKQTEPLPGLPPTSDLPLSGLSPDPALYADSVRPGSPSVDGGRPVALADLRANAQPADLPAVARSERGDGESIAQEEINPDVLAAIDFLHLTPEQQLEPFKNSPDCGLVREVIAARADNAGRTWNTRSTYTSKVVRQWARKHFGKSYTDREASAAIRKIGDVTFPRSLRGADPTAVSKVWDSERTILLNHFYAVCTSDADWVQALRQLVAAAHHSETGHPRVDEFVAAALSDEVLLAHPPMHADVIVMKLDKSFSQGSSAFGADNLSGEWDLCISRKSGEDSESLADRVLRCLLKKLNDPSINSSNIWLKAALANDLATRCAQCLENDEADPKRGRRNKVLFWNAWQKANVEYRYQRIPAADLSITRLCALHISTDEAKAPDSLGGSSSELPPTLHHQGGGHRRSTDLRGRDRNGDPLDPSLRSRRAAAVSRGDTRAIHAIDTLSHGDDHEEDQVDDGGRMVAALPGLPPATAPRDTPDKDSRSRLVAFPSGSTGNPNAGETWTQEKWHSVIVELDHFDTMMKYSDSMHAAALCRPCDRTMTTPHVGRERTTDNAWNADACKYCLYRPLAPRGSAEARTDHTNNWKFGTGKGDHSPYRCQAFKRMLAEGGDTKKFPDPAVHKTIRQALKYQTPRGDGKGGKGGGGGRGGGGRGGGGDRRHH